MSAVAEQLRESASSFGDVFKNRNLRRINLALSGSVIGDWAYSIAIAIWAYREGGATAVGLFGVVRYVTMVFVGPLLAALADKYPKKLVMVGADVVRAALVVRSGRPDRVRRAGVRGVRVGAGHGVWRAKRFGPPRQPCSRAWRRTRRNSPAPTSLPRRSRASDSSSVRRSPDCCWQ